MVAIAKTSLKRVRGDQWDFGPISHKNPDGSAIDLTGCTIIAAIEWTGGSLDIDTELTTEDATGYVWVDQANGQYLLKVNETDTGAIPRSQLVLRIIDANGDRRTKAIIPLEVLAA